MANCRSLFCSFWSTAVVLQGIAFGQQQLVQVGEFVASSDGGSQVQEVRATGDGNLCYLIRPRASTEAGSSIRCFDGTGKPGRWIATQSASTCVPMAQ